VITAARTERFSQGRPRRPINVLPCAARPSERAQAIGQACGGLHAVLAKVPAPNSLPHAAAMAAPAGGAAPLTGDRLLHLDLHPFNVLVDERGDVSGVLDWANERPGTLTSTAPVVGHSHP
jgi:Ser/Thr protein kinase RdoA (MazF antagonist)